jgi:hypothetical protein
MARQIPAHLAPLVEQLELDRPQIVTLDQLAEMMRVLGIGGAPRRAAFRLRQHGWLLPTGVRGAYEFAPAERAGPISEGDALLGMRAVLAENPALPVAAALGTALALQNITDRGPDIPELALPRAQTIPRPLRRTEVRILRFDWTLPTQRIRGVPVHRPATVLVHLAHRPSNVRSWAAMLEALPDIVAAATQDEIAKELRDRPHATHVRLAYLTQSVAPALASALGITPAGKVWFGPRGPLLRHDAVWNVADTILPFAPKALSPTQTSELPSAAPVSVTSTNTERNDR